MNILAIIPARSGSKGIKNKNIRLFNNLPLIAHTILCTKKSKNITRIIVSTDSNDIADISCKYGAEVPFLRPKKLSQDSSSIIGVVEHVLRELRDTEGYVPDNIMLLQPTSPLRNTNDINKSILLFKQKKADAVVSICGTENLLFNKDKKNQIKVLNKEFLNNSNRQKLEKMYKLDGSMIFLIKTSVFLKNRSFFTGKLFGYEIERWRAIDLDEPQDFVIGELIHKNIRKIESCIKNFK